MKIFCFYFLSTYLVFIQCNQDHLFKHHYIKPGSIKVIQISNEALKQPFTKVWTFKAVDNYFLKFTFIDNSFKKTFEKDVDNKCQNNISMYNGTNRSQSNVLAKFCGNYWINYLVLVSPADVSMIVFDFKNFKFPNHFLYFVEATSRKKYIDSSFSCNSSVVLNEERNFVFPNSFVNLHNDFVPCKITFEIPPIKNFNAFIKLDLLSLNVDSLYSENSKECNYKLDITSSHRYLNNSSVSYKLCGFHPLKHSLYFKNDLTIVLFTDQKHLHPFFYASIRTKYCPNGLEWKNTYCKQNLINSCSLELKPFSNNNHSLPSCYDECSCPYTKPLWDGNNCISLLECEEILNTNIEASNFFRRKARAASSSALDLLYVEPAEQIYVLCSDVAGATFCSLQKSLGYCSRQTILDQCRSTCDMCTTINSWSSWSTWSTCSRHCEGTTGKQLRFQVCMNCGATKVETQECDQPSCARGGFVGGGSALGGGVIDPQDDSLKCDPGSFKCSNQIQCFRKTQKCDGYYDCRDESDEPGSCELGLRFDGLLVIMNWASHHCVDIDGASGGLYPWARRRCPGPKSSSLNDYWWKFLPKDGENVGGLLRNNLIGLCLTTTVVSSPLENPVIFMSPCDHSYRTKTQLWECEPSTLKVRLKFPSDVLPERLRSRMYLTVSDQGPGLYLNLTDHVDQDTTDFHIYYTDRKNICAKRSLSDIPFLLPRERCTKTCGGGMTRTLRDCARIGSISCPGGNNYEVVPCNTQPCDAFCQPGWIIVNSTLGQNSACIKVINERRNFIGAQFYCEERNWTLVADKNKLTHDLLLDIMRPLGKVYLGIYENLRLLPDDPASHALRYSYDEQPVGGFQPWAEYNRPDMNMTGCIVGSGAVYRGSRNVDRLGVVCDPWTKGQDRFHELELLERPYFTASNVTNRCSNPSLDNDGVWCYRRGSNQPQQCDVPDCLSGISSRIFFYIDPENMFLIRSKFGRFSKPKLCLSDVAVKNNTVPAYAQLKPCDRNDPLQQFFWWSDSHIANVGTKSCLSITNKAPSALEPLIFELCDPFGARSYQAWIGRGDFLFSAWGTEKPSEGAKELLFKTAHDMKASRPVLIDVRRSLFIVRVEEMGSFGLSEFAGRTPLGTSILIRGCGKCLTHDVVRGRNLLFSEPCSQEKITQRWILLTNRHYLNAASGLCLATVASPGYAVMHQCSSNDGAQLWSRARSSTSAVESYSLENIESGWFLRCGCIGISSVCMTPAAAMPNTAWQFYPEPREDLLRVVVDNRRTSAGGVLGSPFLLQSKVNLALCARPELLPFDDSASSSEKIKIAIDFVPCDSSDSTFLWSFAGVVTLIKHRNLDLCLDAEAGMLAAEKGGDRAEVDLQPCSILRLQHQSWVFKQGPSLRNDIELPGDYVRLAFANEFHLTLQPFVINGVATTDQFVLAVQKEDDADKWDALTLEGYAVQIAEKKDCATPWAKAVNYKGTRSYTGSGIRCQAWKTQIPHRHPFDPFKYLSYDLTENYCRHPPGPPSDILDQQSGEYTWCMTLHPKLPWQNCLVSRCPIGSALSLARESRAWEVETGTEQLAFICQSAGECYYETGLYFTGSTSYTGRAFCLNWRQYYGENRRWPNHNHCMNPSRSMQKPWCWVAPGVAQYCDTLRSCPRRCTIRQSTLRGMKIVSISYSAPSFMYAIGSRLQVVCKPGYNVTLPDGKRDQIVTCNDRGEWQPRLVQCRKVFCKKPGDPINAVLLSARALYSYGSVASYQCKPGSMITPGQVVSEVTCLKTGQWSRVPFKCEPACPPGWISYRSSCYFAKWRSSEYYNYEEAKETCAKTSGGYLSVPRNKLEYDFLRHLIMKKSGVTGDPFWVGIKDIGASQNASTGRRWDADARFDALYLDRLVDYHQFKIRNFASTIKDEKRIIYADRCMFGDRATGKVLMKSCFFDETPGSRWTWLTHEILFNVDLGLCLAAEVFTLAGGYRNTQVDTVSLQPCDFTDRRQKFTCGPHSGFLLKLRQVDATYLTIAEGDPLGEVRTAGAHATGPLSFWQTVPDGFSLCHWDFKPPVTLNIDDSTNIFTTDTYFIVYHGPSPPSNSFSRYEPDKCLTNRTGATLARLPVTTGQRDPVFDNEYLNWCDCLYMLDDSRGVVSASLVQGEECARPVANNSYAASSGIIECAMAPVGDSLCTRADGSSPSVDPAPNWCIVMLIEGLFKHLMSPRVCQSRFRGFVCEAKAKWACTEPNMPAGAEMISTNEGVSDLQLAYGSRMTYRCRSGFRFAFNLKSTVTIFCNQHLRWEVSRSYRDDDVRSFMRDTQTREQAVGQLSCTPTACPAPKNIPGLVWRVSSSGDTVRYILGTVAFYSCLPGTEFAPGDNRRMVTCREDSTWQPVNATSMRCHTVTCQHPPTIANSFIFLRSPAYNHVAIYSCLPGYWFRNGVFQFETICTGSAKWDPPPIQIRCVPVSCFNPSESVLERMKARIDTERLLHHRTASMTLTCLEGYWFDKGLTSKTFTCGIEGRWLPFEPSRLQCYRVQCDELPIIPAARRRGSDRTSGGAVEYRCSNFHWLRPTFKILSPHWGLCISVEGGPDPSFETPLNPPAQRMRSVAPALTDTCGDTSSQRDLWIWQWSFHLRNPFTDLCLTAMALPSLTNMFTELAMEKCDRENKLQQWECAISNDQSSARLLTLRAQTPLAYLSTQTDDMAFWSGRIPVNLALTSSSGDSTSGDVRSVWQVYGKTESLDVNICLLREGHASATVKCSNQGQWIPDPSTFNCVLVDCGPPPLIQFGFYTVRNQLNINLTSSQFSASNIWEYNEEISNNALSFHPVSTVVNYTCEEVSGDNFTAAIICRENGLWQNLFTGRFILDFNELEYIHLCDASLVCPPPKLGRLAIARIYPSRDPKDFEGRPVLLYTGYVTYAPGVKLNFDIDYQTKAMVMCNRGYWVSRSEVRFVPAPFLFPETYGVPYVNSICRKDGTWSEPVLREGFNCTPVFCTDPGHIVDARRFPDRTDEQYPYGSVFNYGCRMGYWFSPVRAYASIICNANGIWEPSIAFLRCVPVTCYRPKSVLFAIMEGDNYTIGSELKYTCLPGYFMCGNSQTVTTRCLADGTWSPPPSTFSCALLQCSRMPRVDNAYFDQFKRKFEDMLVPGDYAILRCNDGFSLENGHASVPYVCNSNGSWSVAFTAEALKQVKCIRVSCTAPPATLGSGASLLFSASTYRFGDNIVYSCPPGKITDDSSGSTTFASQCAAKHILTPALTTTVVIAWEPDFTKVTCRHLICPHPGIKEFTNLALSERRYLSTAAFICFAGYRVVSPHVTGFVTRYVVTCREDARWHPPPTAFTCTPVQCPEPGPASLPFRRVSGKMASPYFYLDTVVYQCPTNYALVSVDMNGNRLPDQLTRTVTCQFNGHWDSDPNDPSYLCEPVTCFVPFFIAFSTSLGMNKQVVAPGGFPVNSVFNVSCNSGYVIGWNGLSVTTLRCTGKGTWEPHDPFELTCLRINCKDPGDQPNSKRHVGGFLFGDRIIYYANPGFVSKGVDRETPGFVVTLECSRTGKWRVLTVHYLNQESFLGRSEFNAHLPSDNAMQSTEFTADNITFIPLFCPPPFIPPSSSNLKPLSINPNQTWPYNSQLLYECRTGFFLGGGVTSCIVTCSATGNWFPPPFSIQCVVSSGYGCLLPPVPVQGTIERMPTDSRPKFFAVCYPGLQFRPGVRRIELSCNSSGLWAPDPSNLTCSPITCSAPPTVSFATLNFTGTDYGDTATYKCPAGRGFRGLITQTTLFALCVTSGNWEPNPAIGPCQLISCGPPPDYTVIPHTASLSYTTTAYGSEATYQCDVAYHHVASNGITSDVITAYCNTDGQWRFDRYDNSTCKYTDQVCTPLTCGSFPNLANAHWASSTGNTINSTAIFRCDTGYRVPVNSSGVPSSDTMTFQIMCNASGNWTILGSCVKVLCPVLPNVPNAVVAYNAGPNSRRFNDTATLTCTAGLTTPFGGSVLLECMWFGDWAPRLDLLNCIPLQCLPPPRMNFTSVGSGPYLAGNTYTLTCIAGYETSSGGSTINLQCSATDNSRYFIRSGDVVTISCNRGFWFGRNNPQPFEFRCTNSKTYTPPISRLTACIPVTCPAPAQVAGATSSGTNQGPPYNLGAKVFFQCPMGMFVPNLKLQTVELTCSSNGTFDPDVSGMSCSIVVCAPLQLDHANVLSSTGTAQNDQIIVRCQAGTSFRDGLVEQIFVCDENGRWRPTTDLATCDLVRCPFPSIPGVRNTTLYLEAGSSEPIVCESGFKQSGFFTVLTCTKEGNLFPPPSSFICLPIMCGVPPINRFIRNKNPRSRYRIGSVVELECFVGYWLVPTVYSTTIKCKKNGEWSIDSRQITCSVVQCGTPVLPTRSIAFGDEHFYLAIVTVTCERGYWLPLSFQRSTRTQCNRFGQWQPPLPPTCVQVNCATARPVRFASVEHQGTEYYSTTLYLCYPLYWIAVRNTTHWVLTGKKQLTSVCGETGKWNNIPNRDFRCGSILAGDVPIGQSVQTAVYQQNQFFNATSNARSSLLATILRSARATWLRYDRDMMVISDSYLPDRLQRIDVRHDVRLAWDSNPLSLWQALLENVPNRVRWAIDINFGRAKILYAVMVMCADDGRSDITSFSLVVAGSDKKFSILGLFKVYGGRGTSGSPQSDFPLNYSSVATAWVFDGSETEVLWAHVIIHGTVIAGNAPIIRELGFYATDVIVEETVPIDPTPSIFISTLFTLALITLGPLFLFRDERYKRHFLYVPPFYRKQSGKLLTYEIRFSLDVDRDLSHPLPYINLLLRIRANDDLQSAVIWIRGNDYRELFRNKSNHCSVFFQARPLKIGQSPSFDCMMWYVVDDPSVGHSTVIAAEKHDAKISISDIAVVNVRTGDRYVDEIGSKTVFSSSSDAERIALHSSPITTCYARPWCRVLRCHHLVAMFNPPYNSSLKRVDRFFMAMLYLLTSIVVTLHLQIYLELLPPVDVFERAGLVPPGYQSSFMNDFLRGKQSYLALSIFGCLLCIPLSIIIRLFFVFEKLFEENREGAFDLGCDFCSHEIFFSTNALNLPFMKVLSQPLANFLDVIMLPTAQVDASTNTDPQISPDPEKIDEKVLQPLTSFKKQDTSPGNFEPGSLPVDRIASYAFMPGRCVECPYEAETCSCPSEVPCLVYSLEPSQKDISAYEDLEIPRPAWNLNIYRVDTQIFCKAFKNRVSRNLQDLCEVLGESTSSSSIPTLSFLMSSDESSDYDSEVGSSMPSLTDSQRDKETLIKQAAILAEHASRYVMQGRGFRPVQVENTVPLQAPMIPPGMESGFAQYPHASFQSQPGYPMMPSFATPVVYGLPPFMPMPYMSPPYGLCGAGPANFGASSSKRKKHKRQLSSSSALCCCEGSPAQTASSSEIIRKAVKKSKTLPQLLRRLLLNQNNKTPGELTVKRSKKRREKERFFPSLQGKTSVCEIYRPCRLPPFPYEQDCDCRGGRRCVCIHPPPCCAFRKQKALELHEFFVRKDPWVTPSMENWAVKQAIWCGPNDTCNVCDICGCPDFSSGSDDDNESFYSAQCCAKTPIQKPWLVEVERLVQPCSNSKRRHCQLAAANRPRCNFFRMPFFGQQQPATSKINPFSTYIDPFSVAEKVEYTYEVVDDGEPDDAPRSSRNVISSIISPDVPEQFKINTPKSSKEVTVIKKTRKASRFNSIYDFMDEVFRSRQRVTSKTDLTSRENKKDDSKKSKKDDSKKNKKYAPSSSSDVPPPLSRYSDAPPPLSRSFNTPPLSGTSDAPPPLPPPPLPPRDSFLSSPSAPLFGSSVFEDPSEQEDAPLVDLKTPMSGVENPENRVRAESMEPISFFERDYVNLPPKKIKKKIIAEHYQPEFFEPTVLEGRNSEGIKGKLNKLGRFFKKKSPHPSGVARTISSLSLNSATSALSPESEIAGWGIEQEAALLNRNTSPQVRRKPIIPSKSASFRRLSKPKGPFAPALPPRPLLELNLLKKASNDLSTGPSCEYCQGPLEAAYSPRCCESYESDARGDSFAAEAAVNYSFNFPTGDSKDLEKEKSPIEPLKAEEFELADAVSPPRKERSDVDLKKKVQFVTPKITSLLQNFSKHWEKNRVEPSSFEAECRGPPRLHVPIVTHVSRRGGSLRSSISCGSILSFFLLSGIVSLLMYYIWMGQNVPGSGVGLVYLGAFASCVFTVGFVLVFDALLGRYVFHEL